MKRSEIELAKEIIISILGNSINYSTIDSICDSGDTISIKDCKVSSGVFRVVFIPKNTNFIIKVGRDKNGLEQCYREVANYQNAIEAGLSKYFAAPLDTFTIDGITFFIFEKIDNVGRVKNTVKWSLISAPCGCATFLFDKETREVLGNFLVSNKINDLHWDNFGWDNQKNCVVYTDYAGYGYIDEEEEISLICYSYTPSSPS